MANHFLRRQANWEELYFYKKTDVLYQLTFAFTKRFLKMADRTIDQMGRRHALENRTLQRAVLMVSAQRKWKSSSSMWRGQALKS
jgi:RNA polymerase-interacting CarD/CdnL/TRCF family regulator